MKSIFTLYKELLSNENIRHLLLNYSMTSNGARHPSGPAGWVIRDEGQVDIYAGKSRIILGLKGEHLSLSTAYHNISEKITFTSRGITNFRILGKTFNVNLFEGQKVLATKPNVILASYSVIGPNTYVVNEDGSVGRIVGSIPIPEIFDERLIFEESVDNKLLPPSVEIFNLVKTLLG